MTDQEAATAASARDMYPPNKCPACHQPVPPDQAQVEIGDNGLILAASLKKGLGPPLVEHSTCKNYQIYFNGQSVDEVVAYDCKAGLVWRYQKDHQGNLIIRDDAVLIEKLKGHVRVELRK